MTEGGDVQAPAVRGPLVGEVDRYHVQPKGLEESRVGSSRTKCAAMAEM